MPEISPEWTAELKKGSIQLCLLALLAKEEKYGFQILHELKDQSNGFFDLKEGTLYPALRRLEERGFVSSRWQAPKSGMPRKYYRLTDRGRVALREALAIWDTMTRGAERVLGTDVAFPLLLSLVFVIAAAAWILWVSVRAGYRVGITVGLAAMSGRLIAFGALVATQPDAITTSGGLSILFAVSSLFVLL